MPAMIYNGKIYGASSTLADDIIYDNSNSGLRAGTVGDAIDELAINGVGSGGGGMETTLIWENPNPTDSFSAQTVALDLTNYTIVLIEFNVKTSLLGDDTSYESRIFTVKNVSYKNSMGWTGDHTYLRYVTLYDDGVKFSEGQDATSTAKTNNELMVPVKIYGIKNSSGSNGNGGSYLNHGEEREMLWKNPSMDSLVHNTPFEGQSIAIQNLTSYKAIEVLVFALITTAGAVFPETTRIDSFLYNKAMALNHGHDTSLYLRDVAITENEITFGDGYQGDSKANHRMIPIAIFGIKDSGDSNSNLVASKWKLHGTFTGSEEQSLPEQFDELCIIVHFLNPTGLKTLGKHSFNIPYMDLEDSYYEYKDGESIYYNGVQHDTLITVAVNRTNVKLVDVKTSSGSEVVNGLNVSTYSVYYK